ncbi:MAG: hypothetical protein HY329_27705, partial [Chloroflexi bacterium]|nr:hypothetical protein [Chloroflexota bacterium]
MAIKAGPEGAPSSRLPPRNAVGRGRSDVGGTPAPVDVVSAATENQWQPAAPAGTAGPDGSAVTVAPQTGGGQRGGTSSAQQSDNGATAVALPEHPKRADTIKLSGEMEESAFEDQQWLVQRDGRFIQLTELLYRILEQASGQQTHDQIAASVSERYGKRVSADNVRQLLQTKLIPMGLIARGDGSVASTASSDAMRSPLAVNLRIAMVSPRVIDPITAVLEYLFWPPVLIVTLLAAGAAQFWLYFVHGVGSGVHDVIYRPGLLLLVLAAVILSAGFHEFGHAAALRYGGGKVRGMGAGIYLVYPAFYTDVTDAYRLGRWGRVRTDLGGIYFNFIFALGI